jgi:1-acyl-sn-glycerol-3-phosphate acyltransferase
MTIEGKTTFTAPLRLIADLFVTAALWIYYIMGFLLAFSPFYLYAFFFSARREEAFQKLNYRLHRLFFSLLRFIVPRVRWRISPDVSAIRSSIIISNHLSFLDPILFVSLFERQKTIVKGYFRVPVFGWILKTSGYITAMQDSLFTESMMRQISSIREYLLRGGNLFIFPEGARSRSGRIGAFDKGAFSIARLCRSPIKVVVLRNTHKLYPPGKILFNACDRNVIEVELAGTIEPDYESGSFSLSAVMAEARSLMEGKLAP